MVQDYKDIVIIILQTLKDSLIAGTKVQKELLWAERFGVSEKCIISIFEELIDSGYIKGCVVKTISGEKILYGISNAEITLSGVDYLEIEKEFK